MRWNGWGDPSHVTALPPQALRVLTSELGLDAAATRRAPAVALTDVVVAPSRLPQSVAARLRTIVGDANVLVDRDARVLHAAGRGYPDLLRLRAGDAEPAPDAVVGVASADEVAAVLETCSSASVAVVPFGGGTSVVGGVEPLSGNHAAVIALELKRLAGLQAIDERSLTATFAAGTRLPDAEAALAEHGLMLGHLPQSFEYATIGGCVATRSAGQASTGYGRIDALLRGVELIAPAGQLALAPRPASAAGPELRQLVTGSEGVLGVIVAASLQVRPRPELRRYEAWTLPSFADGVEALRKLVQRGAAPEVARLSDEPETQTTLLLAGGGVAQRAFRGYLRARGRAAGGALLICGWEGARADLGRRRSAGSRLLRAFGAIALGTAPGRAWERGRFAAPYLRDALMDRGVLVETLETATSWSSIDALHRAVADALRGALAARGTPARVLCHVSHLYPTGASLYFTFIARQQAGAELEQWRAAKAAASDAIVAAGATITHHHAVGRDHLPWLEAETGRLGLDALRAVKETVNPASIMNPGKLLAGRDV